INKRKLSLPYRSRDEKAVEGLSMVMSRDRGKSWQFLAHLQAGRRAVEHTVAEDGEYWFAVLDQSGPRGRDLALDRPEADLKVVVDTVPPVARLDVRRVAPAAGQEAHAVEVDWHVAAPTLAPASSRRECGAIGERGCRRRGVPPVASGGARRSFATRIDEVRLTASDLAGNKTTEHRFLGPDLGKRAT